MAKPKTQSKPGKATVTRKPADPVSLYPAARLRAELTLSGAFRIPPPKSSKNGSDPTTTSKVDRDNSGDPLPNNVEACVAGGKTKRKESKKSRLGDQSPADNQTAELHGSAKTGVAVQNGNLSVECPVMLVHRDEDVLVALLAIAAATWRRTLHKEDSNFRRCLIERNPGDLAISIDVLRSELVDLLGWNRNSRTYTAVSHSLLRLASTRISWKENYQTPDGNKPERESNLIGFADCPWLLSDSEANWVPEWKSEGSPSSVKPTWTPGKKPLKVLISSYLSAPVLDANTQETFGLHWTKERASLGPSGRCLYSQLAAIVWPGSTKRTAWNRVVKRLYSREPDDRLRGSATRLLKTMPSGWAFEFQGSGPTSILVLTRPAIRKPKNASITT